ncbi:hypothetical protein CARUB_v10018792mg [Capsella rubella]|uniref:KIB1-4 beta-propeller domain-containing protein n=1 Tax=Capsella rubella TaxID=81985 RepID=R0H816_9BRAS|nr:hypothetical protein CARUB_v10018792mg [Capsella rubella]
MDTLLRKERRPKVYDNHYDWSKLFPDLLRKMIESLSSIDYHRAKTVCSYWYCVWKTCVKRPQYPWQVIYYGDDDSLSLFDPRENNIYNKRLLGLSDNSHYMASSGNWLLMADSHLNFYFFNLSDCSNNKWGYFFQHGLACQVLKFDICGSKRSAVVWIDERTEDYFVAWILKNRYLFTHKKGDDSWCNQSYNNWITTEGGLYDLAYKNGKLYLYTYHDNIKIIDFSGDSPKEEMENNPYRDHPFPDYYQLVWGNGYLCNRRIAIQKSGEVLIIWSCQNFEYRDPRNLFYIFKLNLESNEWERVYSIGDDEMLIFGHGVTIKAPVQDVGDGIKSGSICFVHDDTIPGYEYPSKCGVLDIFTGQITGYSYPSNCGVFDLATGKITWTKIISFKSHWFVPRFA